MAAVFIIVPCFNEDASVLHQTLTDLLSAGYSVVLVDDGSTINQQTIAADLPVSFLRHEVNLGQGAALQTGTEFALEKNAEYIVHFDADGQHQSSDIRDLLQSLFTNEYDVSFGSRFLTANHPSIPPFKKIIIAVARFINYLFTGILLSDAHNGMRAFNKKAASSIIITENRMSHASEILFEVKKNKLRYCEVPVTIVYSSYSRHKGQSGWNSIRIVFDLLLHKLFQ
ncbi:MAG: glycosyltransferase family 2 protein [Chitinophagaceae bacterium]|nr:glycosyltransferase family 2 protein [Chitinophagaceae bacterium]